MAMMKSIRNMGVSDFPNLRFRKRGIDIKKSVIVKLEGMSTELHALKMKVADICKKRELDPNEVLEADDDTKMSAYEVKASTNLRGVGTSSIIQQLDADLRTIREEKGNIALLRSQMAALITLAENIEEERTFDLTFSELLNLGFEKEANA